MTEFIFLYFILPLAITILYGLIFAQREDKIRKFLAAKSKSWTRSLLRRLYVRILIGAIRGHAATSELLILLVIVGGVLGYASGAGAGTRKSFTVIIDQIGSDLQAAEKIPATRMSAEAELESIKREMRNNLEILKARNSFAWLIEIGSYLLATTFGFLIAPYLLLRRRFAFELERFINRIQGLASREELIELTMKESKVKDEESAKEFLNVVKSIANKNGIAPLVKTLDLWEEQQTQDVAQMASR